MRSNLYIDYVCTACAGDDDFGDCCETRGYNGAKPTLCPFGVDKSPFWVAVSEPQLPGLPKPGTSLGQSIDGKYCDFWWNGYHITLWEDGQIMFEGQLRIGKEEQ